jgi:hypothetical protein
MPLSLLNHSALALFAQRTRIPTSARSIGFCAIWVCISSSSSSYGRGFSPEDIDSLELLADLGATCNRNWIHTIHRVGPTRTPHTTRIWALFFVAVTLPYYLLCYCYYFPWRNSRPPRRRRRMKKKELGLGAFCLLYYYLPRLIIQQRYLSICRPLRCFSYTFTSQCNH